MTRTVKRILGWTLAVISFSGFTTFFAGMIATKPNESWISGFILMGILYVVVAAFIGLIWLIMWLVE